MSDSKQKQDEAKDKAPDTAKQSQVVEKDESPKKEDDQEKATESAEDTKIESAKITTPKKTTKESKTEKPETEELPEKSQELPQREHSRQTPADPSKNAYWYVVHTYSGHEQKVSNTLKQRIDSLKLSDKILDIIIPTQEKIEIKEGKKSTVKEKIFPGYLLVNMIMDDNSWLAVRTTPGITGFIGTSTKPTPLPEEEVRTIKRYMTMEAPKFKTTFTEGEAIKITDGPFNEFLGTISEIDEEKGKIKVMVSVFGRETPVELDLLQVAKL